MPDQENPTSPGGEGQPQTPQDVSLGALVDGAVKESAEGAGEKVPGTPTPRTFSEEEFSKMQSKLDAQVTKLRKESQERETTLQQSLREAEERAENARFDSFLKGIEDAGGDVNVAKVIADEGRKLSSQKREFLQQKHEVESKLNYLTFLDFQNRARELSKQYELGEDSFETLMDSKTNEEMENKALKAAINKQKAELRPPAKVDSGSQGGSAADFGSMPENQKAGMLMDEAVKRAKSK